MQIDLSKSDRKKTSHENNITTEEIKSSEKEKIQKLKELKIKNEERKQLKKLVQKNLRIKNFKENMSNFEVQKKLFYHDVFQIDKISIKCIKIS